MCLSLLKLGRLLFCGLRCSGGVGVGSEEYSDEDGSREIEIPRADVLYLVSACRMAGVSDASDYTWRKKLGGVGRTRLAAKKAMEKENDEPLERHRSERKRQTVKRNLADLEFDKLILKQTLDCLKLEARRSAPGRDPYAPEVRHIRAAHLQVGWHGALDAAV